MLTYAAERLGASIVQRAAAVLAAAMLIGTGAAAQETTIRKTLEQRMPQLPKIDGISKSPIPGLYEIRVGNDIYYADEEGNHLIQGSIIDTRTRTDLTQARIDKLTAIDFSALPLKDAIVWKQGTGARKLAVFADPNCGYCKQFERDLGNVKNVTVYTFLFPMLGGDSPEKSRNIWCAKDATKAWRDWMIEGKTPPRNMGRCDTAALDRNIAFARKHRVTGTPTLVFENGMRVPGALPADQVEKQLTTAGSKVVTPR
jgi:thiol:disulfide interchange protein DsbC